MPGKLGIGVYNTNISLADVVYSNATVALLYQPGPLQFAAEIKAAAPGMALVGRVWFDPDVTLRAGGDSIGIPSMFTWPGRSDRLDIARNLANFLVDHWPSIDIWQLFNEGTLRDEHALRSDWLRGVVEIERVFAAQVHARGKRFVALNHAVGSYPTSAWEPADMVSEYVGIIAPLLNDANVDYLGLHAYGCSRDDNKLSGGGRADCALRHRILAADLRAAGVRVPPIIFTEYGQNVGWKGMLSEDDMWNDIRWWADEVLPESGVFGSAYFSLADSGGFAAFDINGTSIPGRIRQYNGGAAPPPGGETHDRAWAFRQVRAFFTSQGSSFASASDAEIEGYLCDTRDGCALWSTSLSTDIEIRNLICGTLTCPRPGTPFTFSGQVLDVDAQAGMAGVQLAVNYYDVAANNVVTWGPGWTVTTDSQGNWSFTAPDGTPHRFWQAAIAKRALPDHLWHSMQAGTGGGTWQGAANGVEYAVIFYENAAGGDHTGNFFWFRHVRALAGLNCAGGELPVDWTEQSAEFYYRVNTAGGTRVGWYDSTGKQVWLSVDERWHTLAALGCAEPRRLLVLPFGFSGQVLDTLGVGIAAFRFPVNWYDRPTRTWGPGWQVTTDSQGNWSFTAPDNQGHDQWQLAGEKSRQGLAFESMRAGTGGRLWEDERNAVIYYEPATGGMHDGNLLVYRRLALRFGGHVRDDVGRGIAGVPVGVHAVRQGQRHVKAALTSDGDGRFEYTVPAADVAEGFERWDLVVDKCQAGHNWGGVQAGVGGVAGDAVVSYAGVTAGDYLGSVFTFVPLARLAEPFRMSGYVVDLETITGIPGVPVRVNRTDGGCGSSEVVITDSFGLWRYRAPDGLRHGQFMAVVPAQWQGRALEQLTGAAGSVVGQTGGFGVILYDEPDGGDHHGNNFYFRGAAPEQGNAGALALPVAAVLGLILLSA